MNDTGGLGWFGCNEDLRRFSDISVISRFGKRGIESYYGQEFFFLYFVAFDALLAGRLVPYKCNQT